MISCHRHFFFTAMLYVYGRILSQQIMHAVTPEKFFYKLAKSLMKYQMVICYFLYITGTYNISISIDIFHFTASLDLLILYTSYFGTGFVWFIVTLKKKMYKYQFSQYAWTHMILIVVFTQSSFTAANIFEGIFW